MSELDIQGETCDNAGAELVADQQACPAKGEPVTTEVIPSQIDGTLNAVEAMMLSAPQIDCPVNHHFGLGIYIREAFLPAGTYIMGHAHKHEHMNVMVKGKMAVIVNGEAKVIEGPCIFTGQPGRKFAYIIEDTVFQNIYATTETDLDVIEDMFVDKSKAWNDAQERQHNAQVIDMAVQKYLGGKLS